MPSLMERSLIRFGDGGCVVTLPVAWLRFYGLQPGDKVELVANGELIIRPITPRADDEESPAEDTAGPKD